MEKSEKDTLNPDPTKLGQVVSLQRKKSKIFILITLSDPLTVTKDYSNMASFNCKKEYFTKFFFQMS